ncbi:MAG: rhodanese-like domain-containing protein [Candidatus Sericytochromatia bacterium]
MPSTAHHFQHTNHIGNPPTRGHYISAVLEELRDKLGTALQANQIITYCGAGAAAASLANVLVRLGHPRVAMYDGGLMEWCADPKLPLQTGM